MPTDDIATTPPHIGIQLGSSTTPMELGDVAAEAERLGYTELWLAENYFELGGFVSSATALAATGHIPVGLGVVAASVRHPAVTAMEIATLAERECGRFMAGLGHGSPGWIRQMALEPKSPVGVLREATSMIRRLLDGDEVTERGFYFEADRIRLEHPPARPVPIYLGVHGPASLRLSGELADGTLLGWFSSPGYTTWARERIDEGRALAGITAPHHLVVLCLLSISDDDPEGAKRDLARWCAPLLKAMAQSPQLRANVTGVEPSLLVDGGSEQPWNDPLVEHLGTFAAAGSTESCRTTINRLIEAGADRVVLVPNPAGRHSTTHMVDQMRQASALVRTTPP